MSHQQPTMLPSFLLGNPTMLSYDAGHDIVRNSRDFIDLPQPPPPVAYPSQHDAVRSSADYLSLPFYNPPAVHSSQRSMQRTPYRLSEGRMPAAGPSNPPTVSGSVRMTVRQPLNNLPLEYYEIHSNLHVPESMRGGGEHNYLGRTDPNQPNQAGDGVSPEGGSPPLPFTRPRLPRSQAFSNVALASNLGLMTFRMEPNGQSAVVIRHSEGRFQPGQLVGCQSELATCFESKMCPICQEEWIWKGFTPAEMALIDSSGAEWEVARLPCGHAFHSACLAVWFHEISIQHQFICHVADIPACTEVLVVRVAEDSIDFVNIDGARPFAMKGGV